MFTSRTNYRKWMRTDIVRLNVLVVNVKYNNKQDMTSGLALI